MTRLVVALLATLMGSGPATAQQTGASELPGTELPPALERVLRDYEGAWRNRDATALARLFADDGFVMAPGRPPARGRAAIERYYTGRGGPLFLRALAWAASDDVGWIIGGYATVQGQPDAGKFSLTLRRDPSTGAWLIVTDMDNGNS